MSSPSPFAQHKFYILPIKLDQERIKSLAEGIVSLDGTCLSHLTDATFIITGLKSPARIQRHIHKSTCPVVHANWIADCVTQQRFMDPSSYRIQVAPLTPPNNDDGDSVRPKQMRSWDDIYATYRQQCRRPVSKHAILHGYDPGRKKKRRKTTIRREPSYQTTTSGGDSSLEQGHPWWAETSLYQATTYICEQPSPLDHCNQALVDIFEFLEHTRELRGDTINGLSYRKAAAVLKTYPHKIKSAHEALQLKGIGKKTGRIIEDYLQTGEVSDVAMVKADEEFKTLELFYNIHGVGATTAREWYNKGHRSLEDVTTHEQLSKDQLLGIKYYDDFLQRIPREQVEAIVDEFSALLEAYQSGCDYTVCGSYRRGKATSGDIDILVTHPDEKVTQNLLAGFVDRLQALGYIRDVLSMSGRGDEETANQNRQALCVWLPKGGVIHRRLDLIVVPWCDYAVAVLGWTGSRYFERSLRLRAKQMKGLKVTSHGIFRKGEKLKVESERQAFEGIDDALAIILAYLSPDVDIKAITLTHGNVGLECVKKNAAVILHALDDNQKFLKLPPKRLPVLAIGASLPLAIKPVEATYFHGEDGIGMIYNELHKAPEDWERHLLHQDEEEDSAFAENRWFETTPRDAADEILYQLKQVEPLTMTIAAIGPLTNLALAYQRDPITFSRAKRIVIMGGAVNVPGNICAYAEFNFRADPHAAQIVMGTSKGFQHTVEGYQRRLDLIQQGKVAPCHIVIMPLDGSDDGTISKSDYEKYILPLGKSTPLYGFVNAFMRWSFEVCMEYYNLDNWAVYDAYTVLLMLEMIQDKGDGKGDPTFNERWDYEYLDLTVETEGQYTLGMCCVDRRDYQKDKKPWDGTANNVQCILAGRGGRFRNIMLNTIFDARIGV